jgi:hypothetical protein
VKPIIEFEEFKAMSKEEKIKYLTEIRLLYSAKDIRTAFKMTYGSYDYYLTSLGLKDKSPKKKDEMIERQTSNNVIIEADYYIHEEKKNPATEGQPIINFPNIVGNTAQLRKRFEAIIAMLECEEEATFQVTTLIYKL